MNTETLIRSAMNEIPRIMQQLNLTEPEQLIHVDSGSLEQESDDWDNISRRRSWTHERALVPRVSSLENSLIEHISSSVPTLDELVIRQRGRRNKPAKISWSPLKSPFKTPTKKNSSLHMSILSPSPAKKLFNNSTSMVLRSSPRKRLLVDTSGFDLNLSMSTPCTTPTKRLKFVEDRPMNATNPEVPMKTLLKGLSQDQLIDIICSMSMKDQSIEQKIRENLPLPDVRPLENQLCSLRKNVIKSSPRSRLLSRTDSAAFSRASTHLMTFKKTLMNHLKTLSDSQHYDALIDYILMAWTYVKGLPVWDEPSHNILRKDCFKILSLNGRAALKNGGTNLGSDRIANFQNKLKSMMNDYDDIGKCHEALKALAMKK